MANNVVTGMYILLISLFMLIILLIYLCYCLGSFLVNGIPALVLFDSGATRSYVSLALSQRFDDVPGRLIWFIFPCARARSLWDGLLEPQWGR